MAETTIHQDEQVYISTARAVFEGKTYALANITSISAKDDSPYTGIGVVLIIVAVFAMGLGLGNTYSPILGIVIGAALVGLGIFLLNVQTYIILFSTAASEVNVFTSSDRAYRDSLVESLNKAIIERG